MTVRVAIRARRGEWERILDASPVRMTLYPRLAAVLEALRLGRTVAEAVMPDEDLQLLRARHQGAVQQAAQAQRYAERLGRELAERERER